MTDELNPEAEELYLVSLLLPVTSRILRDEALARVAPEDFWSAHYGTLWAAAVKLHDSDQPVTKRALLTIAGSAAVERIVDRLPPSPPPAHDFPRAVAEVRRCGQLRRLVQATDRIRQRAMTAEDHAQALGWAMDELAALDTEQDVGDVRALGSLLERFVGLQRSTEPMRRFPTPWAELDEELAGGLFGGRFYVIGARPGDGKSIAAHQIAEFAASSGSPALVFSAEMKADEVTGRVVSAGAQVEIRDITRRELDSYSWGKVLEYVDRAKGYPLFVVDKSELSIPYIKSVCRSQKRRTGLDVVAIDYLQLLSPERGLNRERQVAEMSRDLKLLAMELDVAVVVPTQLSREAAKRGRPALVDLRESGAIEQDADVVILQWRQQYPPDHVLAGQYNGVISMDIAKNRHGRQGSIELPWRAHYSTIGNARLSVIDGGRSA